MPDFNAYTNNYFDDLGNDAESWDWTNIESQSDKIFDFLTKGLSIFNDTRNTIDNLKNSGDGINETNLVNNNEAGFSGKVIITIGIGILAALAMRDYTKKPKQ